MSSINGNFSAMTGARLYGEMSLKMNRAMEHMATGKRINRASDDPSGAIAVSALKQDQNKIKAGIAGKEREMKRLGAFDGAASVIGDMLTDLQGLLTTAASSSGATPEERKALGIEATEILKGIDHLANTTTFEKQDILQGFATVKIGRVGEFTLSDLRDGGGLNLESGDLEKAQKVLDSAAAAVNGARAAAGSRTNSLESEVRTDLTQLQEQEGARSLIEDADIARETSVFMRTQVLRQAAAFAMKMFQQSDSQTVLQLLG